MHYFLNFDTSALPEDFTDVLICGSGIAGLTTALTLKELGINPVVLTRGIGNTYYSQGGIASAVNPKDSPFLHHLDTQRAGRGLCDERALWVLVDEGIQRINDLERWGVRFDKDRDFYETTLEGGHSLPRVLKVKDYTGRAIYNALLEKAREYQIPIVFGELQEIIGEERVCGVIYNQEGLKVLWVRALVLATGGASSMFLHTSNPVKVRGDAIGTALRLGAVIRNPEFVQFHPTVVEGTSFLISEAVRGEGAILVNQKGERFIDELKPRDEVARAIYSRIKEGERVFLDLRPIIEKGIDLDKRFPTIMEFLKSKGIKELIPVVPAAHYYIGGIDADLYGRTRIMGLYAVGECACTGVHGANRLASNSLLEGVVFGYRTAHRIYQEIKFLPMKKLKLKNSREEKKEPPYGFEELKSLMWQFCGLEREKEGLLYAINYLKEKLSDFILWKATPQNRELLDISLVALGTLKGAYLRQESRGVHYRKDFPFEREEYRKDTFLSLGEVYLK